MKCIFLLLLIMSLNVFSQDRPDTIQQKIPGTTLAFTLVKIPDGSFELGNKATNSFSEKDEQPVKKIKVDAFYIGKYEVTYEEYEAFSRDESTSLNSPADAITRPSPPYIDLTLSMGKTSGFPANSMQQFGALMFCRWLYNKTGEFYRLPTEAEWEYACRAGSQTVYPFGNDSFQLKKYAWYTGNSDGHYHKVGELLPNAWGLYDMLGNVAEWTLDQYDENFYSSLDDTSSNPVKLPTARHPRTVRGGNYNDNAAHVRSSDRLKSDLIWNRRDPQIPKSRWWNADAPFVGFRIVKPVKQPTAAEAESFFKLYLGK